MEESNHDNHARHELVICTGRKTRTFSFLFLFSKNGNENRIEPVDETLKQERVDEIVLPNKHP